MNSAFGIDHGYISKISSNAAEGLTRAVGNNTPGSQYASQRLIARSWGRHSGKGKKKRQIGTELRNRSLNTLAEATYRSQLPAGMRGSIGQRAVAGKRKK